MPLLLLRHSVKWNEMLVQVRRSIAIHIQERELSKFKVYMHLREYLLINVRLYGSIPAQIWIWTTYWVSAIQGLQETSLFDPNNALLRWLLLFFIGEMSETWPRSHHYLMPETDLKLDLHNGLVSTPSSYRDYLQKWMFWGCCFVFCKLRTRWDS